MNTADAYAKVPNCDVFTCTLFWPSDVFVTCQAKRDLQGGWCHNVRNGIINVGNFPGKTDIHVVIFYDYQMRSISFGTHLMIQTIVSIKKRTIGSLQHRSYVIIFVIRPCRKREVGHRPQHVNSGCVTCLKYRRCWLKDSWSSEMSQSVSVNMVKERLRKY